MSKGDDKKLATLKDVARQAGVSVSTASYSINDSPLISDKTKSRVLKAAKEIGYRPNGIAKNLKEQKTNIIGLFLSGFTGPTLNEMVEGVQDEVIKNNYEFVVSATVDSHKLLVERYVEGAIILNYHIEDDLLLSIADEKMPCVVLDREIQEPYIKNVLIPNEEGSRLLVQNLLEQGHKRIGYMTGADYSFDGERRLQGFRQALEEQGIEFLKSDLIRADFTEISGFREMVKFIDSKNRDLPTAFVCGNDEMAIGAIRALQTKQIKVPEDIAVVGFDNIILSNFFTPSLTTIQVPRKQWGTIAAQTLLKMLDGNMDFEPEPLQIELIKRNSG